MEKNSYCEFVLNFFKKLGCEIKNKEDYFLVKNVCKSFSDIFGSNGPYNICFDKKKEGCEFVFPGSLMDRAISKFLDNAGKTSILKIEFDLDPVLEIKKKLSLKNCIIESVSKKYKNHFFSRFSFLTTFRYLNEKEQLFNEIYVHKGKIVKGDLSGYNVVEGNILKLKSNFLKKDFELAKIQLKELLESKTKELTKAVGLMLDSEIKRINVHYEKQLNEISGDLNSQINRIKELEFELRICDVLEKKQELRLRIDRLRKNLVKKADDDLREKILREQDLSIMDAKQKFSLDISNKLLNTTIIYYPVFYFNLFLKNNDSKGYFNLIYDPLTKDFENLCCDSCNSSLNDILLCSSGHVVCLNCFSKCDECSKNFCKKCLSRSCDVCGKKLCKNCLRVCKGCGKTVCNTHIRTDCVNGEKRCINCLRACINCHGFSQEKFFGISTNGSKVCLKCLGSERRENIMKNIFDRG